MGREVENVYAVALSVQALERASIDEVTETERGVLFVATPQPPRVGARVQLDLTTPGTDASRIPAVVVWSRPARPGVVAGFRAQIMNAPPDLVVHLRDLAGAARAKIEQRENEQRRSSLDSPITERIRLREVTSPMRNTQPPPVRETTGREATTSQPGPVREDLLESLPPLPSYPPAPASSSFPSLPGVRSMPPPAPTASVPPPSRPPASMTTPTVSVPPPARSSASMTTRAVSVPPPTRSSTSIATPAVSTPAPARPATSIATPAVSAPPPVPQANAPVPAEPTSRQRSTKPLRVTFSSSRNYLLHYEQFLAHGRVYVSNAAAPELGTLVALTLEVPDGDEPLVVTGVVERTAQPPEVPQPGWIAKIEDRDGTIGERLATATFIVGTPTAPPPVKPRG